MDVWPCWPLEEPLLRHLPRKIGAFCEILCFFVSVASENYTCISRKGLEQVKAPVQHHFFVNFWLQTASNRGGNGMETFWKATLTGNGFPWLYASGSRSESSKVASFTGRSGSVTKRSVARQAESGDLVRFGTGSIFCFKVYSEWLPFLQILSWFLIGALFWCFFW